MAGIAAVRPYFRTILNALSYTEWKDGFNSDNIPATLINKSYHIMMGNATADAVNQTLLVVNVPVSINLFIKGFRDPASGIDTAILAIESIVSSACKTSTRAGQTSGIKNIVFNGFSLDSTSESNDNIVKATLDFTAISCLNID